MGSAAENFCRFSGRRTCSFCRGTAAGPCRLLRPCKNCCASSATLDRAIAWAAVALQALSSLPRAMLLRWPQPKGRVSDQRSSILLPASCRAPVAAPIHIRQPHTRADRITVRQVAACNGATLWCAQPARTQLVADDKQMMTDLRSGCLLDRIKDFNRFAAATARTSHDPS